jgi:hypothetical protein
LLERIRAYNQASVESTCFLHSAFASNTFVGGLQQIQQQRLQKNKKYLVQHTGICDCVALTSKLLSLIRNYGKQPYHDITMRCIFFISIIIVLATLTVVNGFSFSVNTQSRTINRSSVLYMGRAAAVRAATKSKTDGAKAKNNSR